MGKTHFSNSVIQTHLKREFPVFLFFLMLLRPQIVFSGACKGLLLWFEVVLPTLYPFLLLSNFLLTTGNLYSISALFGRFFCKFLKVSPGGSFVVLAGFLCGYPVGAKLAADMYKSGYISREEGCYLLSFCNNTSPSFIINFLVLKTLCDKNLLLPSLLILTIAPLSVSFFTRRIYLSESLSSAPKIPKDVSLRDTWSFREIDACIMDSFETLMKVGGYIILFSVIVSLLQTVNAPVWFSCLLSSLEITNGLEILKSLHLARAVQYPLMLGLTAFGGFCAIAQTQCMVQKSGFGIFPYIAQKLAAALTASLLGILYLNLC